ncbi:MAG: adenylate/guanylate cyclase domain-containing protein [Solirubrobacterales bacterium]|nr:adenylate/guanylate cyclase domain-containing protein [Solirubrobacterales bacterium]
MDATAGLPSARRRPSTLLAAMGPETRYARSGEFHIAYQAVGAGPLDLIYVPTWISQVEHYWEEPIVARYFNRLASFSRLILFDRRGSGLSDPVTRAPTLEEQMDDVVAVMDAVGSRQAAVYAQLEGGAMAALFAATHPERTSALILYAAMPRMAWAPDYDWALRDEEREEAIRRPWGDGSRLDALAPESASDPRLRDWFARLERLAASPGTAAKLMMMTAQVDVRAVLPTIQVPTLVLHRTGDRFADIRHSRYLQAHIPGARLVELPGNEVLSFGSDSEALLDEIEEFLTGERQASDVDRVLATVMFSDIVDSTRRAAALGDQRWRDVLVGLEGAVVRELVRFRGRPVKTLGDGFLATFDGPARAIRAASAIHDAAREGFGLEVRTGLHTGEVEVIGDDVGGIAVHIGARVGAYAEPGEVLVSGTVKDLVVGSGIRFADRGERELKGVPGTWRLWSVAA